MNSLIEKIKILASIEDDSNDEVLRIHIENSINAIIQLVKRQFEADTQGLNGVTSMTQGSRSVSYSDAITLSYTIDDSIKALLPKPYARLF